MEWIAKIERLFPSLSEAYSVSGQCVLDHIDLVLRNLDTDGLSEIDSQLLTIAAAYHDVGKAYKDSGRQHPKFSLEDAAPFVHNELIIDGGRFRHLTEREITDVLHIVRWHHIASVVYVPHEMPFWKAALVARDERMLDLLHRHSIADSLGHPIIRDVHIKPLARMWKEAIRDEWVLRSSACA